MEQQPIPMGKGILSAIQEHVNRQTETWAGQTESKTTGFTPTLPNSTEAKKQRKAQERNFTRQERREMKRGGGPLIGNNRPNHEGREVKQQHKMLMMQIGEEPRLVDVATVVRGKGGKKKVVMRRTLLSREIISTGKTDLKRLIGTVEEDENESIKNGIIHVATTRNGRMKRA